MTGVSRRIGIGHAIACRAADYGASIVAHHYRPHDVSQPWGADDIEAVMASIRSHLIGPAQLIDVPADLAAPGEPARVVEQAVNQTVNQAVDQAHSALTPDADWVVLATGGARGITAELLEEMAVPGMRLVLLGRSAEPESEPAALAGLQTVAQLRAHLLDEARARGVAEGAMLRVGNSRSMLRKVATASSGRRSPS